MAKKDPKAQCKLSASDTIQVTPEGFVVNGVLRESLAGCDIEAGARFTLYVKEEAETSKVKHRAPTHTPTPTKASEGAQIQVVTVPTAPTPTALTPTAPPTHQASTVHLPPEFAELEELINVYQTASGAGPYVAICAVAYVLWQRTSHKGRSRDKCPSCRRRDREAEHRDEEHRACQCDKCRNATTHNTHTPS